MPEPLRYAYFARGLDGLFLPPVAGCEAFALVRGDSPEESWIGSFVPPRAALVYQLRGHKDDPYPATGDVLPGSDIARLLQRRGIGALLLSSSFTPQVRDWAAKHGIRILAADYEQQRRLENKLWFDRFLARHGIPRPKAAVAVVGNSLARRASEGMERVVVQRADSQGGEGTFYLDSVADWPQLCEEMQLPRGERCLVRAFIDGRPLGITVFVAPGVIALSAVRLQCYHGLQAGQSRRLFAGVQWLPSDELSLRLRARMDAVFRRLGKLLYRRRYFGFANFDFVADDNDRVWLIECNPRMSAATPQLLADAALSGGVPTGRLLLGGFLAMRKWPRRPAFSGLPASTFAGATLDIISGSDQPCLVRREYASGTFPDRQGGFQLFSLAARGQLAEPETTLGTILADAWLYDARGELNAAGRRLIERFRYT
jgi:GNAT superfamily N-acetyltransferase